MNNKYQSKEYCTFLIKKQRELYTQIKRVYCPILGVSVNFNSVGFRHLQYKSDGTRRNSKEIIYKLNLLPLVVPVVKNSIEISEKRNMYIRMSRKKNSLYKEGIAYALTAKVGKNKTIPIKVIILKIGNGNYFFYSVMKE